MINTDQLTVSQYRGRVQELERELHRAQTRIASAEDRATRAEAACRQAFETMRALRFARQLRREKI